jgi:hypothetical protein
VDLINTRCIWIWVSLAPARGGGYGERSPYRLIARILGGPKYKGWDKWAGRVGVYRMVYTWGYTGGGPGIHGAVNQYCPRGRYGNPYQRINTFRLTVSRRCFIITNIIHLSILFVLCVYHISFEMNEKTRRKQYG